MSCLVFDLDGVVITFEKNFAETYSQEFSIPINEIYEFFSNDYYDCAVGKAQLASRISNYSEKWKWPGSTEDLIDYWFNCQSQVDTRMIEHIKAARNSGHLCFAASDQDEMRSNFIQRILNMDELFDGFFFSFEVGAMKTERVFFEHLVNQLPCLANEIFFWDDNPKNVQTAKEVGINAETYSDFERFSDEFSERFVKSGS